MFATEDWCVLSCSCAKAHYGLWTMMVYHIFDGYYKVMRQLDCFRSLYRLQLHKHREPVDRYPADH